jgi:hypothetical protein
MPLRWACPGRTLLKKNVENPLKTPALVCVLVWDERFEERKI